ncbi:rhodanese-like domain-containing protein [Thermonema rossianum]|nr:rhodanese-like domain-containing protein [Thermonema rossianum]
MFANYFKDLGSGAFYEALQQDPEAVLLDVRTEHEFEEVHLEGALLMNINSGVFLSEIETLDRSKHYLCVLCGRGAQQSSLWHDAVAWFRTCVQFVGRFGCLDSKRPAGGQSRKTKGIGRVNRMPFAASQGEPYLRFIRR